MPQKYMGIKKWRILTKSYIFQRFIYCPLVWMCHSRNLNNKIDRIQERALQILYRDLKLSFKELLKKGKFITTHQKTYSTLPQKSTKLKWASLQKWRMKFFDSAKILSMVLEVIPNLLNHAFKLFNSEVNL